MAILINQQQQQSNTLPLHMAVIENDEIKLTHLLTNIMHTNKVRIDDLDNYGRSAMHWAAMLGLDTAVQLLLDNNADPNIRDYKGHTPLHLVYTKNIRSAKLLLNYTTTDPDIQTYEGETPLFIAASKGNVRIVKMLLKYKANQTMTNNAGLTPLYMAITNGHVDVVILLINNATNVINAVNDVGETLLHTAALTSDERMIAILCSNGARFTTDKFNSTPLHWASAHNNPNATKLFIDYGIQTDTLGSFINHKDGHGNTPLHYAAWHGYYSVAYILLSNGADTTIKDNQGFTPKDYAVRNVHHFIVELIDAATANDRT